MKPRTAQWLVWTPRILTLLFAAFISLFAMDSFGPGKSLGQQLVAFALHLIPTYVILIVLALSWRREWIGCTMYALFGLAYLGWFGVARGWPFDWSVYLIFSGMFFLIAGLFLLSWRLRKGLNHWGHVRRELT